MTGNNFTVLLAEDNHHDIAAIKRVWKKQKLDASAYIVKPAGTENLSETINAISLFWRLVELPDGLNEYN